MGSGLLDATHLVKKAPEHAHESQQKPRMSISIS
jgi:hypothetical protein